MRIGSPRLRGRSPAFGGCCSKEQNKTRCMRRVSITPPGQGCDAPICFFAGDPHALVSGELTDAALCTSPPSYTRSHCSNTRVWGKQLRGAATGNFPKSSLIPEDTHVSQSEDRPAEHHCSLEKYPPQTSPTIKMKTGPKPSQKSSALSRWPAL